MASSTSDPTPGDLDRFRPLDPSIRVDYDDYINSEEHYPVEKYELTTLDLILFITRCAIILFFIIFFVLVMVIMCLGTRLKNWRLFCLVCICVLSWLLLSLYQDHIDEYFIHIVSTSPHNRSIFYCFRNLLHGMSLYLIILLLSHLSDFQRRGSWLWIVFSVVVVPVFYSITLLIIDLQLPPEQRESTEWHVAILAVRIFLYNVVTTALLFIFSPRFCAVRLYGTYEESRSGLVVCISRWVFSFLLLHNVAAVLSFWAYVSYKTSMFDDEETTITVYRALDEGVLLLIVLTIPVSYLVGACCGCCCGGSSEIGDLEMDKMDKIYQEVWMTNQELKRRKGRPDVVSTNPEPTAASGGRRAAAAAAAATTGGVGSIASSRYSSQESSLDQAAASTNPNGINGSRASSIVTLQASPSSNRRFNAEDVKQTTEKRKKRESYLEAVSMGSLDDSRHSVTSEPVDL